MTTTTTLQRTPLHAWHVAAGARIVPFGGWDMPVQYAGIIEEHHATRRAAGLFDTSHMGELRVSGAGAADFLRRMLTRPMDSLRPGRARYALLCAEDGTVIDDCIVMREDAKSFLVVVNAATRAGDEAWLRAHLPAGCVLDDESGRTGKLDLQGPRAEEVLRAWLGPDAPRDLAYFGFADGMHGGLPLRVSRSGYTGEDGFELFCPRGKVVEVWEAVMAAGRAQGLQPCGLGARDTLRLEAGLPLYGHELSRETRADEAGMDWAIDPQGGFVGSAALRATPAPRRLIAFRMEGRRAARAGDLVYDRVAAEIPCGKVTSGSFCPTLDVSAGMAYINQPNPRPGAEIFLEVRGGSRLQAAVAGRPLYSGK